MAEHSAITAAKLKLAPARGPRPKTSEAPPLRVPRAAELVADHIRSMIIRGELAPGDRLQPEAELIERFGTSRATIREAMLMLQAEQFLSVQRGSRRGARVCRPSPAESATHAGRVLQAQGGGVSDAYHVRAAVEPYAVWLLAKRRSPEVVATLRAELQRAADLQASGSEAEWRLALARFHRTLVALTGSPALQLAIAVIQDVVERHQLRLLGVVSPHDECFGLKSFWKLVDFIEQGDAERAQAHWRVHIQTTLDRWLSLGGELRMADLGD